MKYYVLSVLLLALVPVHSSWAYTKEKPPVKSSVPLTPDEIAVYRALLHVYRSNDSGVLNVSQTSVPLDLGSPMSHQSLPDECLSGLEFEDLTEIAHSFHELPPEILPAKNFRLVDPAVQGRIVRKNDPDNTIRHGEPVDEAVKQAFATGLFTVSEIAFDKHRRFAVVTYGFWCGMLCGNGRTLVLEKVGDAWKNTGRKCGGWIS